MVDNTFPVPPGTTQIAWLDVVETVKMAKCHSLTGERAAWAAATAMIKALDSENTALRIAHLTGNLQDRRHLA